MAEIGKMNSLQVVKQLDFGIYVDGGDYGEILVPSRYVPEGIKQGDIIDVFLYRDSEDRLIATTEKPLAIVGEFAFLKVVAITTIGAFLDWGLVKDIFLPYREQAHNVEIGKKYLVHIYLDKETERIVASTKTDKFLDNVPPLFTTGEEVDLMIAGKTELGYKAIINNTHSGIIYKNEVFKPLKQGQKLKGYIKKIRADFKIDLSLQKKVLEQKDETAGKILEYLKQNGGKTDITDKSNPEIIYRRFEVSKKTYKMALGALYKKKLIVIEDKLIRLA
ncbi:MAG: S1-like domain-containing RNA-binding protein [Bacteroidales bacterium]